jgi:hypothetical protein
MSDTDVISSERSEREIPRNWSSRHSSEGFLVALAVSLPSSSDDMRGLVIIYIVTAIQKWTLVHAGNVYRLNVRSFSRIRAESHPGPACTSVHYLIYLELYPHYIKSTDIINSSLVLTFVGTLWLLQSLDGSGNLPGSSNGTF